MAEQEPEPEAQESTQADARAERAAEADKAIEREMEKAGAFEAADEDGEPQPEAESAEAETEEGEAHEEPEIEEAAELEGDEAGEEGDEESSESHLDEEDDAIYDAITTLRAQGVPSSVLKNTPKAKLIAWGMRARAGAGASGSSRAPGATADGQPDGRGQPAQAAPAIDWAEHQKVVAAELGIEPEAAEKLYKPMREAIDRLVNENKELAKLVQDTASAARAREGQATIDMEMRRLERDYPGLSKDEDAQREIVDMAKVLVDGLRANGKEIDVRQVFKRAATLVNGKPKRSDLPQLRRNGTATPPERVADRSAISSEEDYWTRVTDLAVAGRSQQISKLKPPPIRRFGDKPKR